MILRGIMVKIATILITILSLLTTQILYAKRYVEQLFKELVYHCIKIKSGQSWEYLWLDQEKLWPDAEHRYIVKRINRMNISLSPGMKIAVPSNLAQLTIYDVAPFPRYIESTGEKTIYVDQEKLAWGAYDVNGELIWWGPV